MTTRTKIKIGVATTLILAIAFCGVAGVRVTVRPTTANAATPTSDKYDGDCQPTDTAGRCADKCPADTTEGAYYLQGYDKDTGAAVCGFSFFNACPYADAVSADDPLCDKLAAEQNPTSSTPPAPTTTVAPVEAAPVTSCASKN